MKVQACMRAVQRTADFIGWGAYLPLVQAVSIQVCGPHPLPLTVHMAVLSSSSNGWLALYRMHAH